MRKSAAPAGVRPDQPEHQNGTASETLTESRDAVLQLLLGDRGRAAAAAQLFDERLDWSSAVAVCSDWGALPQLNRRLEDLGVTLTGPAQATLRRWTGAVFLRSASSLNHGVRALSVLADAGVDAAAFKGVAAVATIHDGPKDRTLGDTDIVLRRRDVEAAVAVLECSGFRLGIESSLASHVEFIRKYPNVGNQSVSMFAGDGSEIDLHWQLGRLPVEAVLADARPADVYGRRIRIVSDAHGFLLGVHHTLRNGFELDSSVRGLLDCRAWLELILERGELEPMLRQAAAWGLAAPALATARILTHLDPAGPMTAPVAAWYQGTSASEQRVVDALTECFFLQRAAGRWNIDLLRTLDVRDLYQFLKRTFRRRTSYTALTNDKHPGVQRAGSLRQRLGEFGKALPRTRWRLVLALKGAQDRAFTPDAGAS